MLIPKVLIVSLVGGRLIEANELKICQVWQERDDFVILGRGQEEAGRNIASLPLELNRSLYLQKHEVTCPTVERLDLQLLLFNLKHRSSLLKPLQVTILLLAAHQAIIADPLDQTSPRQFLELLLHILQKRTVDLRLLADDIQL